MKKRKICNESMLHFWDQSMPLRLMEDKKGVSAFTTRVWHLACYYFALKLEFETARVKNSVSGLKGKKRGDPSLFKFLLKGKLYKMADVLNNIETRTILFLVTASK